MLMRLGGAVGLITAVGWLGRRGNNPGRATRREVMVADRFAGLADHVWTYRYRGPAGGEFSLYDQICTSPDPADAVTGCSVMCRTQITGGATDHDPAIIELDLQCGRRPLVAQG